VKSAQQMSEVELLEKLPNFDGWILGDDPCTRRVLEAGKRGHLKAVVKWGDFFIQQETDSAILLKWTTQLEVNSNQFVVERSIDGNTFTKIDSIKSSGNSLSRISYSFIDNDTNLLKLPVKLFYKIYISTI
jgi:hypothetical protein